MRPFLSICGYFVFNEYLPTGNSCVKAVTAVMVIGTVGTVQNGPTIEVPPVTRSCSLGVGRGAR